MNFLAIHLAPIFNISHFLGKFKRVYNQPIFITKCQKKRYDKDYYSLKVKEFVSKYSGFREQWVVKK